MKKEAIKSLDLIRAVCALGIVSYHFSCHLVHTDFKPFFGYANGNWGFVFVSIFFMVSGGALYYNYQDSFNVVKFYKKRWLAIFPMYYLTYFSFELGHVINSGSLFFRGNPVRYLFTLIGMDGYLSAVTQTYYTLGEWFLGAIIILYILFPIILHCFKRNDKLTFLGSLVFYLVFRIQPFIDPITHWSLASCLFSFVTGMMAIKYRTYLVTPFVFIAGLLGCLVLWYIRLPIASDVCDHLFGGLLYCLLMIIGEETLENKWLYRVVAEISKLSYAVFLIHHVVIVKILNAWHIDSAKKVVVMLGAMTLMILFEAKMLSVVTDYFVGKVKKNL